MSPIKELVLGELKRLNIWSGGKTSSPSFRELPTFQQTTKLSQMIKHRDLVSAIVTKELWSAIRSLADVQLIFPQDAQFLISLPNQGDWRTNGLNWHVDISSARPDRIPGIQLFVLIDDVKPKGGATLALSRSHLLEDDLQLKRRVREILRGSDDVERDLRECNMSIVEVSGQAGDVYLMDMRLLHTPSINSTRNLRMMATARCLST